jgi:Uma2 family endonuclease
MSKTPQTINNIVLPPTQDELPCDDGIPMETQRHKLQMDILIDALLPWLDGRSDGYVGGNMFVYYSMAQVRNQDFRGPDFFAVLGVPKTERKSWVVWEEGKAPDVVVELISESTATTDKTEKKQIYQNQLRVPEYIWFDPFNPQDWAGFYLQNGVYQSMGFNAKGQMVSRALGLALQLWEGNYKGVETTWLRWANVEGDVLPTEREIADRERQRADEASQRADEASQRADRAESQLQQVALNLIQQGMDLDQVERMTGLSRDRLESLSEETQ